MAKSIKQQNNLSFWRIVKFKDNQQPKICIPRAILPKTMDQFYGQIQLQVASVERKWRVQLEYNEARVFMGYGLEDFCSFFNIKERSVVWFELVSNNLFNVKIGKPNGIEKNYGKYTALRYPETTPMATETGEDFVNVSFCAFLHSKIRTIRIPNSFFQSQRRVLSGDIVIKVDGGYSWSSKFVARDNSLDAEKGFLKKMKPNRLCLVIFTHVAVNTFHINVFDPCGLEMDYDMHCKEDLQHLDMASSSAGFMTDTQLSRNKKVALFDVNAHAYEIDRIQFIIKPMHVYNNNDYVFVSHPYFENQKKTHMGGSMLFVLGDLEFVLTYVWNDGHFRFNRGWNNFVKKSELKVGDMLVIQPEAGTNKLKVCIICSEQYNLSRRFAGKTIGGVKFASIVNDCSIRRGRIALPALVQFKYGRILANELHCHLHDGLTFTIEYYPSDCALTGFGKLLKKLRLCVGDVVVVTITDTSNITLNFWKRNGTELKIVDQSIMAITEESTTQCKRRKISEMESSEPEEYFELVNVKEEDEGEFLSEIKERRMEENTPLIDASAADLLAESSEIFYEGVFKVSHVEPKSRGVYLDNMLCAKVKHWSNGTETNVRVGDRTWKIRLIRRNNSLRFGAGWNGFIEDKKVKEGQHFRYSLINAAEKLFSFIIDNESH